MTTHVRTLKVLSISMFIFSLFTFSNLSAQTNTPSVLWQKSIGGSLHEDVLDVQRTADGGSIAVGYSNSQATGDKTENNFSASVDTVDIWIVKLDAAGVIQWENTISANSFDWAESVKQTADGGYIIGANSFSNISGDKTENAFGSTDYWLIKLDANGVIQWQKTMGGTGTDNLSDIQVTADGGFIAGGYSDSGISGNKTVAALGNNDMWIIKFDANGNEQWQKAHGTPQHDILNELKQTTDGGYILGGHFYGATPQNLTIYGAYDFLAIKIDAAGDLQWQKAYGGSDDDYIESLQQTTDGGYILGGYSRSNISGVKTENSNGGANGDYWLVKVDANGTMQWQNAIGGSSLEWMKTVRQTQDGGYIIGGYSYSGISGDKTEANRGSSDFWIVKTNDMGSIQWQKTLGGNDDDVFQALDVLANGNYILCGWTFSDISSDKTEPSKGESDFWIINLSDPGAVNTPSVSDVYYCQNAPTQPLTAVGQDLLWYTTPTGGVGSTTAPTPTTTTVGYTTYYVSQTINTIESPRVAISAVVKAPPSVTISGMGTMCAGTSQTITAYAGVSFLWNDGVTTGQRTIAPTTTTTYTVTITGHNGCTNTGSRTFIVNTPPVASITSVNAICNGTSTSLTANAGSVGTYSYRWSTGQTTQAITVAPNSTRTYSVTVTGGSGTGCTSSASKMITVNGIAPSSMSIVGLATSYPKNAAAVTLVGNPTGGTFRVNNQMRTTFNPQNLSIGNHTVTYTITQGGCNAVISRTVAVTNAGTSLLAANATSLNAVAESNRIKLIWSSNTGESNDYFEVQKMDGNGIFKTIETIKAKDAFRNSDINYYTTYDLEPVNGENVYRINTLFNDGGSLKTEPRSLKFEALKDIQAFPNPAVDVLDVNLEKYMGKAVIIKMYNQLGAEVMTDKIDEVNSALRQMDVSELQNGNYILRVASPNVRDAVLKIVVNK